ncbi:hypothetical protein [Bacillus sp. AFS096315]|uniref:hypothetical protein n=1 Tax=Bacillus sp. AFS096315 TaxID=2033517 RepID=UPI000BEB4A73|nr:hypothetical protein [Bacillus sp. AFS096315]PEC46362.1 hypothetical protein CON00_23870 [Bacillus sp. AFS096315]
MDNSINIEESVNENTIIYGIGKLEEINSLTVRKQLIQIEEFLQEFCTYQKQLSQQINQFSKLTISSVSEGAKVPRSQIYSKINTLKLYIENRIIEINKKDILNTKKFEKLKCERHELETYLYGLRLQVLDFVELKLRLEMLEVENKRLIQLMESRQKDVQKLEEENSRLIKTLSKYNDKKIVPIC